MYRQYFLCFYSSIYLTVHSKVTTLFCTIRNTPDCIRTPGAHLDGDGAQLPLLVQVEEAQRSGQVRLLPVDHIGWDAVQNLVIQQVDGPFLSHRDRTAVTKCTAGTNNSRSSEEGTHTCSSCSREEPSGRKGRSMSAVTDRFGGRRRV